MKLTTTECQYNICMRRICINAANLIAIYLYIVHKDGFHIRTRSKSTFTNLEYRCDRTRWTYRTSMGSIILYHDNTQRK